MATDPYAYAYLTGALALLALWLLLYWRIRQVRREMLWIGAVALLNAIPLEVLLWTHDWWHPTTLTGTTPGPEDFVYAFANQSTIAIAYTALLVGVFHFQMSRVATPPSLAMRVLPFLGQTILPILLVDTLRVHSSPATLLGTLLGLALMLWQRRDLVTVGVCSAICGVVIALPLFVLLDHFFPGLVRTHWYLDRLSGITILTAPLEDLLWYGYTAAFLGVFYKYWYGVAVSAPRVLQAGTGSAIEHAQVSGPA